MYNKIFTKILDSSIWLESDTTRIVWFTFLASMDEDGVALFASIPNLAHRARVSLQAAEEAIKILESPDKHSSDPDNEGRRIERIPGGWVVLNAEKYRNLVTRVMIREKTRLRVAKYRAKQNGIDVTPCNAETRKGNDDVTESYTRARAEGEEFPPPVFEKLIRPLYRKTGEAMIKDAEKEIKQIEDNPKAWIWELNNYTAEFIEEITKEAKQGWQDKVEKVKSSMDNYHKKKLRKKSAMVIDAWKQRIVEIRKAINGVK